MNLIDAYVQEYEQETALTRKTLERVPDDTFAYKPHEKSMSMGQLASHLAESQVWIKWTLETTELDIERFTPLYFPTRADLLTAFDQGVKDSLAAMQAGVSNEHLMQPWKMTMNDQTVFEMPRMAVLRTFGISHMVHHRAQLGVYLRINDVPLPAIYGPSGDEQ